MEYRNSAPLRFALLVSSLVFFLCVSYGSAQTQTCQGYTFTSNRQYTQCNDLSALSSFIHWTHDQTAGTVNIAFRHTGTASDRWTAWSLNPRGQQMVGSQALVAFVNSSGVAQAFTTSVDSFSTTMQPGNLSFQVSGLSATFANSEMTIFATLHLPQSLLSTNQVWQEGPVSGTTFGIHPTSGANTNSMGTINFVSGEATTGTGTGNSRIKKRNVHGVLNAVSWGTLMPLGAMMARYLKVFKSADPAWFYLHVATQASAYIVGVAGFATGIKLGSDSAGITWNVHRNIGIVLFVFGTLQLFALLLRPKKDHKYRVYWNIYHHSIGYSTIILSIINVFEGLDILAPEGKWKKIYTGILIFLGFNAAILEAFTWYIVLKRRKAAAASHKQSQSNGVNGVNGYGATTQHNV